MKILASTTTKLLIIAIALIIVAATSLISISGVAGHNHNTTTHLEMDSDSVIREYSSPQYVQGQIILPDYAQQDTLIVVNAIGLNKAIAEYDPATDSEISIVLNDYCITLAKWKQNK